MDISQYIAQLGTLAGVGALIAVLINILKTANIVKEGQSVLWSTGLNIAAIAGLFALKVFSPGTDVTGLDATAAAVANAASTVFTLLIQLLSAKGMHLALKGVPVIGKVSS